jgi:hypothetical protein
MQTRQLMCTRALKGIKNPIQWVNTVKSIMQYAEVSALNKQLFDFLKETADSKVPMMTKLATVTIDDMPGTDVVNLWAAVGQDNPLDRIRVLKSQCDELKRLLELAISTDLSEIEKREINVAIKHFN